MTTQTNIAAAFALGRLSDGGQENDYPVACMEWEAFEIGRLLGYPLAVGDTAHVTLERAMGGWLVATPTTPNSYPRFTYRPNGAWSLHFD